MTEQVENNEDTTTLENAGRRKAVKTIVGGVTAVAAYNLLPAKWGVPIIESVFLPAHAATSGTSLSDPCTVTITRGDQGTTVHFRVDGYVVPATSGLPVNLEITTIGGPDAGTGNFPSSMTGLVTDADGEFSQEFGNWAVGTERIEVTTTVEGADGSASCAADVPQEGQPLEIEEPTCTARTVTVINNMLSQDVSLGYMNPSGDSIRDVVGAGDTASYQVCPYSEDLFSMHNHPTRADYTIVGDGTSTVPYSLGVGMNIYEFDYTITIIDTEIEP